MVIQINVDNQRLRVQNNMMDIVAGTMNFVTFKFNLSSDWDGLTKTAQFIQNGTAYSVALDNNNSCNLPQNISSGKIKMTLHGTGQNIIANTKYIEFNIIESIYIANA